MKSNGERALVGAWRRGLVGPLRTTDGRSLAIVFRGRCPGGAGPDVRGALLAFDGGTLIEGDVEFHQRSSGWPEHGHQNDPHYRSVALHVVFEADAPAPCGADGQPIPTLVVPRDTAVTLDAVEPLVDAEECHRIARQRAPEVLSALLDQLGDRRLLQRAARFEADLTRLSPDQTAYEALFDALGFSRNRTAFVRLAQAVPYNLLSALIGRRPEADALLLAEAILFGAAGLLPSQRPERPVDWAGDDLVEELEASWALYRADWEGARLAAADWIFGGVRPANYPSRRIAVAARLVVRHRDEGLEWALLRTLGASVAGLEALFLVDEPESYWAAHADFGRPLPGRPAALLGRDRARDTVINVVLPLALARAATLDDPALTEAAWSAFRTFPRSSAYESTRALAADLGIPEKHLSTARRQQGLLYLLRNHCERAGCKACPMEGYR